MNAILNHCRKALPHEACGAVFGMQQGQDLLVSQFEPLINIADNPRQQFLFKPEQWVDVVYGKLSPQGCIGIVHSHPNSPGEPSEEDLHSLRYNFPSYWIISFETAHTPVIAAYAIRQGDNHNKRIPVVFHH